MRPSSVKSASSASRLLVSVCILLAMMSTSARANDIVATLEQSQGARLASFAPAATRSERASVVQRSFEMLARAVAVADRPELRVVQGPVIAECLLGHVVVANESLADLAEPVRLFLLAHELGHITLGHWSKTTRLYARYLPGDVDPTKAQSASAELVLEASRLARADELEADAFAYATLRRLGYTLDDMVGAFTAFGMQPDTATHPSTGKRIAHLRSLG